MSIIALTNSFGVFCNFRGLSLYYRNLLLITLLILSYETLAAEQQRPQESSRFYGRGNTYVAAYDSDEASRANPATLSESQIKFQMRWLQLDLLVGENSLDSIGDMTKMNGEDSAVQLLETFEDKFGKRQYARMQVSPLSMRIKWFEISPFFSTSNFVDMRLPTTPEVELYSDTMAGMNISFGFPLGKTLNFGLTLRPAHRTVYAGKMSFGDLIDVIFTRSCFSYTHNLRKIWLIVK